MKYALFGENFYVENEGKLQVLSPEDMQSHLKGVTVAFLDCQSKQVLLKPSDNFNDPKFEDLFDKSYLYIKERLSPQSMQLIGAKKSRIEEIYHSLSRQGIQQLIPYPVAVRAYLKAKELLDGPKIVVLVDDLGGQSVITVFEGMAFSTPRSISGRDIGYLISEVKRSRQSFNLEKPLEESLREIPITVASNNQLWLTSFMNSGTMDDATMLHVNPIPVFEGLKLAKFAAHFAPAAEIHRNKQRQLWEGRLKLSLVSGGIFITMLVAYGGIHHQLNKEVLTQRALARQKEQYSKELKELYPARFLGLTLDQRPLNYKDVYLNFLRSLPPDYLIDYLTLQKHPSRKAILEAVIHPGNQAVKLQAFKRQGMFLDAKIAPIIIHKVLGQRISLELQQ